MQKAFLHGGSLRGCQAILSVTNQELGFKVFEEYRKTAVSLPYFSLLEPCGRNTAPAVAAAALMVQKEYGPQMPVLVLAADHLIEDQAAFARAVARALELSRDDSLVIFGFKPNRPETGYGYIEAVGEQVLQFVEKPNLETAASYLKTGNFFWNSGMFCFKAGAFLDELNLYAPKIKAGVEECLKRSKPLRFTADQGPWIKLDDSFRALDNISIDYALMEKSKRIKVVTCDIGWSDVGSWDAFCALSSADAHGNTVSSSEPVFLEGSLGCHVRSDGRLVAVVGCRNLLVIDTPDALLVADKKQSQRVKNVYQKLKQRQHPCHRLHRTVERPWGSYTVLEGGSGFQVKRLNIKPGGQLSLQAHSKRNEHWVVVAGQAEVTRDQNIETVRYNCSVYIYAGQKHRVINRGPEELVMIEVQCGSYLGEDDIVRFEDRYGRM